MKKILFFSNHDLAWPGDTIMANVFWVVIL